MGKKGGLKKPLEKNGLKGNRLPPKFRGCQKPKKGGCLYGGGKKKRGGTKKGYMRQILCGVKKTGGVLFILTPPVGKKNNFGGQ